MGWDGKRTAPIRNVREAEAAFRDDLDYLTFKRMKVVWDGERWVAYCVVDLDGTPTGVVCLGEYHNGFFMIKIMDDSMGPCYYDFPAEWLDELGPPVNDWAREWRNRVKEAA